MLLEKATQYAEDCISGKEPTTPEVITQCQWFLSDREKENDDDFAYRFCEDKLKVIEGILKLLNFATGFVSGSVYDGAENYQAFFMANIFGWRYKSDPDRFRYREVVLFIARKNAKTFMAALIIIIILMLTEDKYSEFYSICLDRDLAGEIKKAIRQILDVSPLVGKYFKIPKTLSGRTECTITHSTFQPRTAQANSNNSVNSCRV